MEEDDEVMRARRRKRRQDPLGAIERQRGSRHTILRAIDEMCDHSLRLALLSVFFTLEAVCALLENQMLGEVRCKGRGIERVGRW